MLLSTANMYSKDIQSQLSIVDKVELPFEFDNHSILQYCENDVLYILPKEQDIFGSDKLYIFSYDINKKKLDSLILIFPQEHKLWDFHINSNGLDTTFQIPFEMQCFSVSDKYFVIEGRDRFLVFEKHNKTYSFKNAAMSKDIYGHNDLLCFTNFKIVDDMLLGYRCTTADAGGFGNFSSFAKNTNDTQLVSTAIMKYDLKNNKCLKFKLVYPEPKGVGFLNFAPRNNMDCNGKYCIISDITEYNLYLYDTDWNLIAKINPNHKEWVTDANLPNRKTVASLYKGNVKDLLALMNPFTYTTSLIHNIYFKNDSTFLVSWSAPSGDTNMSNRYIFFFDEFKITNKNIKLVNTFIEKKLDKNSTLKVVEAEANIFKMPREYFLKNNYLMYVSGDVPLDIFSNEIKQISVKEYYKKLDDYYTNNGIKNSILIYRFKK